MADDNNPKTGRGRAVLARGTGRGVGRGTESPSERIRALMASRGRGTSLSASFTRGVNINTPGASTGESEKSSGDSLTTDKTTTSKHTSSSSDSSKTLGSATEGIVGIGRGATRGFRDRGSLFIFKNTRPKTLVDKKGIDGSKIDVYSNYFAVEKTPNFKLLQYRVDFDPPLEMTRVKKALLYRHKDKLPKFMFDGSMMFTSKQITEHDAPLNLMSKLEKENCDVRITIRLVGEILPSNQHYTQFFNIVLRSAMEKLQLELIKRDYYDPKSAVNFNVYKLELWPGYITSIRQHEEKVLMCCEISNKVLRTDTVLDQMAELIKRSSNSNTHATVEKALLGSIVITRYNNRTYRIDEIAWDKHPDDEFEGRNGQKTSYVKYYTEKYNKTIRDFKQPMLVSIPKLSEQRSGVTGPIYLVPELCFMTGLSEEQRANFQLMKSLGDYTRQDPKKRTETLMKFRKRMAAEDIKEEFKSWNLEFNPKLESVPARLYAPEVILGGNKSEARYKHDNADWGNCFRKWSCWSSKSLTKWAVIHNQRDETIVKEFIGSLQKVTPSLGMKFDKPKLFPIPDNKPASYVTMLDKVLESNPQMVMAVVPNNKGDHYAAIKKKCYMEKPVPSQVVTATVLSKPKGLMSVATKVALQMNTKLGGEPWSVKIPLKDTMVIGYDTYHDTLHKGKSVGALVASMNQTMTKYLSVANIHSDPHQELHDTLCPAIAKALRKYKELNNTLPDRIIIYRDGVGDGQIPYVVDHELGAIKQALVKAGLPADQSKLAYIIVNKKINTKFMQKGETNPPSGTVVDDVVTLPERYDFFLVSQSVRQGTVNPTSYNVVLDTTQLKVDHLQKLTYKLAHLYYNWPGTVRVPAPVQYAHKLAFLVGETLHHVPNEKLEETLFYL